ncbi:MAG: glycosyl hydrolase family 28-related protein, partial [Micropepsaceae bacterium]
MTLSTTTTRIAHAANGSTAWFAFPFKIWAPSDLKVSLRDNATLADTPQTLNSHYTLNVALYPGPGNVVFITPPPATKTVVIEREIPETQDLDLATSGAFAAENVETQLDKIVAQVQQLRRRIADLPVTENAHVYNVKDFGAKCDGITEDHTAIQAAIDAAATTGG